VGAAPKKLFLRGPQKAYHAMSPAAAHCDATVAAAAPWNPIPKVKMHSGSSTRLAAPEEVGRRV